MTDNEIIKALECCTKSLCWECPFCEVKEDCEVELSEEDKIKMAVCKMQAVLPTVLYVFYFRLGWKKKRMNTVGDAVKQVMQDAPKGKMKEIREVLRKDCGMVFYSDGRIDYVKAK